MLPLLRLFIGLGRANAPKGEKEEGPCVGERAARGVVGVFVEDLDCRATGLGMPEGRVRGGTALSGFTGSSLSDPDESEGERTRSE
jgi:hypothetical protein